MVGGTERGLDPLLPRDMNSRGQSNKLCLEGWVCYQPRELELRQRTVTEGKEGKLSGREEDWLVKGSN